MFQKLKDALKSVITSSLTFLAKKKKKGKKQVA